MKKKIKFYYVIVLLLILLSVVILSFTIPFHIATLKSIRECSQDPECMRCAPGFEMIAPVIYFIVLMFFVNAGLLIKEIIRVKKKNKELSE